MPRAARHLQATSVASGLLAAMLFGPLLLSPTAIRLTAAQHDLAMADAPGRLAQQAPPKNATFGIQPASAKGPDDRSAFSISATPGATLSDHFAAINFSLRPLTLTLRAEDAITTSDGAFSLLPPTQHNRALGTWVKILAPSTIVVPGRGSVLTPPRFVVIPFSIAIPRNVQPGDHFGGVTVTLASLAKSPTGQTYRLLQAVGSRILVRISGVLRPELTIENIKVHYSGWLYPFVRNPATVSYTVRNPGNVALGARQTVDISGLLGLRASASNLKPLQLLLPGSVVSQSVVIHGVIPQIFMTTHIRLDPLSLPGIANPQSGPYTGSSHFLSVPWLLLLLIALLYLAFRWNRRRRRQSPPGQRKPAAARRVEKLSKGTVSESGTSPEPIEEVVGESSEGTFTTPP